ncbi:MAG: hypothetical protein M0R46_14715 [Candidatus Muirbacterium halophilum]|nr:hypothetical protein [Candidatus Muirbacterium halophilum]MCK9477174.1 hypothetical protein [Candidatus Muirbacterium halophilum]
MNAIRYNELLKKQYERLLSNNKKKKVAIIACMRKLILISYSMFKNKADFSVDFNHSI